MSKYQAYSEYKDSGVEWLGGIPEHWEVTRHKYVAVFKKGKNPEFLLDDFEDGAVRYLSMDYLRGGSTSLYALPERSSYLASKGQVLIIWDGSNAGEFVEGEDGIVSSTMAAAEYLANINKSFYWYLCQCLEPEMRRHAVGMGIPHVNGTELKNSVIVLPTKGEQEKIANFLDHETAKIDTLIDKQQQLIQLLKEKRQAVISHAVTKGLPSTTGSNAPMRDSGVEWLGEVPEHWSFPKVKWFFKTESGGTPNTSRYEEYYQDGDIPWIRSTDLNNNELFETPIAITSKAIRESACTVIPTNSVLIAMYGGAGTIGKHALLKFESAINQAVCAILPTNKINPDFLHLYVEFYRPYWMVGAEGARKDPNINQETIRELVVSSPPYDEQVEIVKVIQQKIAVIDQTVSKCEKNIQLMQERRTALISAAVTGKIDVRDWQVPALMQNKEAV